MRVGISLLIRLSLLWLLFLSLLNAQSPPTEISARSLDALLQDYAFRAFFQPKTGISYDGKVPSNLTGIRVSAMRLRSGSLRIRGVHSYKEFQIPIGVVEQPYVERLVLVYHNLGNWSNVIYPLPGFSYLAPVVGLLTYNAVNLSATDLPELDIRASDKPILIKFPDVKSPPYGFSPKCVSFDLHGSLQFDKLLPGNVCSTIKQGHFSIVVESTALSPAPAAAASPTPSATGDGEGKNGKGKTMVWLIVGCLVGGSVLLILFVLLVRRARGWRSGKKIKQMERVADTNEALQMTSVGNTKAPQAVGTRTRPILEDDYVP
ncbi:Protein of unknown function (DUF1191) [Quillaja saponaria]|uniref:Uncharacterized protein n=1 Tax=Quillaja saponaria TaxID=32244 RepID=A0AAD7LMC1_QUISA|nr:Protein of unknown function (DUF1191) [Quillaja saponaria]